MLWSEGQKRLVRERRDRLTELFTASRDAALDVLVSTGQAKPKGAWALPSYARRPVGEAPQRTPAERDRALAALAVMYPGVVRRTDS
jgi:hypothetical protein